VRVDTRAGSATVDVVQFFTGDAAATAAEEDGAIDLPPPNDYWIRNDNALLRTLSVVSDTPVTTNALTGLETGDATMDLRVSLEYLEQVPRRRLSHALFWITTKNDTIVRIAEQYLP
jgi:hypothetical protein